MPNGEDYPNKEALAKYKPAVEQLDLEVKGKKAAYTSINGWMHSFLDEDGLLNVRVGKKAVPAFLEEYQAEQTRQYGRNMPDFVKMVDNTLEDLKLCTQILSISKDHCLTLKPKK